LYRDVDITGTSSCAMLPLDADEQSLSVPDPSFGRMQATFNTLAGNPFSSLNEVDYNLCDSSNDSDESESEDDNAWNMEDDVFHLGNRYRRRILCHILINMYVSDIIFHDKCV